MTVTTPGRRVLAAVVLLAGAVLPPTGVVLQAHQAALPQGRGHQEFVRVCTGCHPAEDAVKGLRRSRQGWQQIVDDMVVRGAEGTDEELKRIVDYLTEHFGPSSGRVDGAGGDTIAAVGHESERGTRCGISRSRWPR